MKDLAEAIDFIRRASGASGKPLAIVMAGHNGSGKSTCWNDHLSPAFQMPLINADRLMLSVLPELFPLPDWARNLRDTHIGWMEVGQKGVGSYVQHAIDRQLPFAMETVFSDWRKQADGTMRSSKIDLIDELRKSGYFVLLFFVGLTDAVLSLARVETRIGKGGHAVPTEKLMARFPRTQAAIRQASAIADAVILADNSREEEKAFSICRVTVGAEPVFDCRDLDTPPPTEIRTWLDVVSPRET